MQYARHGGACCGYAHVYGFDNATPADLDRIIHEHRTNGGGGTNRILEAILSERQLNPPREGGSITRQTRDAGGWVAVLAQRGFRLAAEWTNSNTGRNCYQFLLIENLHTDRADHRRSFEWPERIERALPVEVVIQDVFTPAVRDTLRRLVAGNHYEDILTVTVVENGVFRGIWRDGTVSGAFRIAQISPQTWRKVEFRQGNDGSRPAAQVPPPVPDRPAVRTVLTEYFAVYAGGWVGRVSYDSVADLRADQPRVRRYRTRVFQSDGTLTVGEPTAF